MAEDNPDYRYDMFRASLGIMVEMKRDELSKLDSDSEPDIREILDSIEPRMYMCLVYSSIFRIGTPQNTQTKKFLIIKQMTRNIESYIQNKVGVEISESIELDAYREKLMRFLSLLELPETADLPVILPVIRNSCRDQIGISSYQDSLFDTVERVAQFLSNAYESNDYPTNIGEILIDV